MYVVTRSWSTSSLFDSIRLETMMPRRAARRACSSNNSFGSISLLKVLGSAPNCWAKRFNIMLRWRSISCSSIDAGTSISFFSSRALNAASFTWLRAALFTSRSMFLRTSALSLSKPPSVTPNASRNSSFNSGNCDCSTDLTLILNCACLPCRFSAW